ncbi:hypothetical protein [Variovorax boronicumulans]
MPDSIFTLTKFDAAERQLLLAIRLFFAEEDEVSIHTLAEAAGQVMHDIGKAKNATSIVRDYPRIRPDQKKEWLAVLFAPRNFFKHGSKDPDQKLEFKSIFNDFSLLDATQMYQVLKGNWTPETMVFIVWFGLKYPDLFEEGSDLSRMLANPRSVRGLSDPSAKELFSDAITEIRSGRMVMPNIALHFGLAKPA